METIKARALVCPNCGNREFEGADANNNLITCAYCATSFVAEIGQRLAKVEVDKTKELKNLNERLKTAIRIGNPKEITDAANEILNINKDSYVAKYYYAYGSRELGEVGHINEFYAKAPRACDCTPDEANEIVLHIIKNHKLNNYDEALEYVNGAADTFNFDKDGLVASFEKANDEMLDRKYDYSLVPRDIFVCHSSKDRSKVEKILDAIVNEELMEPWVSFRNLRPNDINDYWKDIEKAIDLCKMFLLVYSKNAAVKSDDVIKELGMAYDKEKPIIEINIDGFEHKKAFKRILDGNKRVDAYTDFEKGLDDLGFRLFEVSHQLQKEQKSAPSIAPQTFKAPNTFEAPKTVEPPKVVEATMTAEAPSVAEVSMTIEEPKAAEVPEVPKAAKVAKADDFVINGTTLVKYRGDKQILAIPNGITTINSDAFAGAVNLKYVTIPESVENIKEGYPYRKGIFGATDSSPFKLCPLLKITLTGSDIAKLKKIKNRLIFLNKKLKSIIEIKLVPQKSNSIEQAEPVAVAVTGTPNAAPQKSANAGIKVTKENINQLSNYQFSGTIATKYLGNEAFVTVPDGVTELANNLFANSKIEGIMLPSTLTKIGRGAFHNCNKLTGITIPGSVKTIGMDYIGMFYGCSALKSITLGEGFTKVVSNMFEDTNIEEIHLPSTLTEIDHGAFHNCSKLKSITIPGSVKTIGTGYNEMFYGCSSLSSIIIKGKEEDLQKFRNQASCYSFNSN